jgi:hypothetical protein
MALAKATRQLGFGFDLAASADASGEVASALRVDVTCVDEASAKQLHAALTACLPWAVRMLQTQLDNPTVYAAGAGEQDNRVQTAGDAKTEAEIAAYWMKMLKGCTAELRTTVDGAAQVRITASAPFPSTILTAYEVAEEDDETVKR